MIHALQTVNINKSAAVNVSAITSRNCHSKCSLGSSKHSDSNSISSHETEDLSNGRRHQVSFSVALRMTCVSSSLTSLSCLQFLFHAFTSDTACAMVWGV